ncbi:ABC-F family ATP-binding cassette domain-containing protein [Curvivirga sp.]|uniref:ABC-F family ATP-binding cassette domain-containing protein n=1 Tax=Curvivirga sp. TaxID=2856848 RepID=UPI003B59FD08
MLTISDLTYRIGGRILIEDASVQIPDGHRVALVGRNGTGKSTLLKLISGQIQLDSGDISVGNHQTIGLLAQEEPEGDDTLVEIVLSADKERTALLTESETATDPQRIAEIHERLADIDAHTAPARAASILAGLGFSEEDQQRSLDTFSGGWRMRVALAAILFSSPDILLLDEPTNHLDLEAALWLENYLMGYPKTLLIVSHDRDFLNKVPQHILHLDNTRMTLYTGNYDQFENARREAMELQKAAAAKQAEQRAHMQAFVDRFRYKASKARQAQSRLKMLEKMEPIAQINEDRAVTFTLPQPEELPPPVLALENVEIGYGEKVILRNLNMRLDMDDRVALLGANGNGKTTLLRFLGNRLETLGGEYRKSNKLEVGYFAQNQLDEMDGSITPITLIQNNRPQWNDQQIRTHLGGFGFGEDKVKTRIADLSGGEKARLALSVICLSQPHILLLDEPTNHLDMDSRAALIQAIAAYKGAVILVSHDSYLVNACADRLWLVADGTCKRFEGDLAEYEQLLLEQRREERRAQKATKRAEAAEDKPLANKKDDRKARAEARAATAELRKKIKQIDTRLDHLRKDLAEIHEKLADPNAYDGSTADMLALSQKSAALQSEIETKEMEWLELSEELEEAMS